MIVVNIVLVLAIFLIFIPDIITERGEHKVRAIIVWFILCCGYAGALWFCVFSRIEGC